MAGNPPSAYAMEKLVVHTIPSVAELSSGPTHSVTRLCEELLDQGVPTRLDCLDSPGHRPVPGFVVRHAVTTGLQRLGLSPRMHESLEEVARSGRARLFHNHSLWMMPNVYPGWVASKWGIPYVVSPRGTFSGAAMRSGHGLAKLVAWKAVQGPSLRSVTCWHATATSEAEAIREQGFSQPVAVVPNGIDIPPALREPSARRTVLYLGRLHVQKRVHDLVEAWARVAGQHPDWCLRIVGPDHGGYLGQLQRLAERLSATRISFEGPLHAEAKLAAYRSAELFVLPTAHENFGMAVAEALAAGTPAIVTKGAPWGGLPLQGAGWWIDHGPEPLAEHLDHAMSVPQATLRGMGERGRAWMAQDFAWPGIARRMATTYDWILAGMHPASRPHWVLPALAD